MNESFQVRRKTGYALLVEFCYSIGKYLSIHSVPQKGPDQAAKLFFNLPYFIYKIGLGKLIESKLLLLTTRGRKTGKMRTVPLEYIAGTSGRYYVIAGCQGKINIFC